MIELVDSDIVYRNPKPYLRSIQARHPSLARFDDGELLIAFDLGQTDESLDYRTYRARSLDGGKSWQLEGALFATAEYRDRYQTNRALNDPRSQIVNGDAGNNPVPQPNTHWGDGYERDLLSLVNLNLPLSDDGKQFFYGFGNFDLRHGSHGGNYRRALDTTDWPQIYPQQFPAHRARR